MFKAAKRVLYTEEHALRELSQRLDQHFEDALCILGHHQGKVVVTGMGKSGHIARKIAATFASTGQPAVFLHPSEGAHGDLGVYEKGDPTIILSKSGTTDEIVRLLPVLRQLDSKIIAILGHLENSPIAASADVVIDVSFAQEADPLGIVPTTSALVSLAVGDALAAELMARRHFSKENFAVFHPAGQLGRNLLIHVKDVMSPLERCGVVLENASLKEIVRVMTQYPLGAALVIDDHRQLRGIITDGDIRRLILMEGRSFEKMDAQHLMTSSPRSIIENATLGEAVEMMEKGASQISVLPVIDGYGNPVGILRLHDVYQH